MRIRQILVLFLVLLTGAAYAQQPIATATAPPPHLVHFRSLPACSHEGQVITLTLNTGTATGSIPTADPIWHVAPNVTAYTTTPFNAPTLWLPNTATEKWIQPSAAGPPVGFPIQTYVYTTQFVTPVNPFLYSSITINGKLAADDSAVVKLNGIQIGQNPGGGTPATWAFHNWKPVNSVGVGWPTFNQFPGFVNTLTIEVKNTLAGSTSGLLVHAEVSAVCSKCSSPVPPPNPPCGGNPSTC